MRGERSSRRGHRGPRARSALLGSVQCSGTAAPRSRARDAGAESSFPSLRIPTATTDGPMQPSPSSSPFPPRPAPHRQRLRAGGGPGPRPAALPRHPRQRTRFQRPPQTRPELPAASRGGGHGTAASRVCASRCQARGGNERRGQGAGQGRSDAPYRRDSHTNRTRRRGAGSRHGTGHAGRRGAVTRNGARVVPAGPREPHRTQPGPRGRSALPRGAAPAAPAPVAPGAPPSTSRGGAGPAGGGGGGGSARPSRGGAAQERR